MKSSCIRHPEREPLIIIRAWQVKLCEGNHCAAALLSFFIYWHDIKLEHRVKAKQTNDIAEGHLDHETRRPFPRTQDESLLQFHSSEELSDGILGIFGTTKIRDSINWLEEKGYIGVRGNPNPRYKFDKTHYFLLRADRLNDWLEKNRRCAENNDSCAENNDGGPEGNKTRCAENNASCAETKGSCAASEGSCAETKGSCAASGATITESSSEVSSEPSSECVSPPVAAIQREDTPGGPKRLSPANQTGFRGAVGNNGGILNGSQEPEEPAVGPSRVPGSGSRLYLPGDEVGEERERAEGGLGRGKARKHIKAAYDPAKPIAEWNAVNVIGYFRFVFGQKWPGRPLPVALVSDAAQVKSWLEWCESQNLPVGSMKGVVDYIFAAWGDGLPKRLGWSDLHPGMALIASRYFEKIYNEMANGGPADHKKKKIDEWDEEAAKKREAEGRMKVGVW